MLDLIITGLTVYSQYFVLFYHTLSFSGFMKALLNAILLPYGLKEVVLYVIYYYPKNKLVFQLFLTISIPALKQRSARKESTDLPCFFLYYMKPKMTHHIIDFWPEHLLKNFKKFLVRPLSTSRLFKVIES